jgi:hypothetical protein
MEMRTAVLASEPHGIHSLTEIFPRTDARQAHERREKAASIEPIGSEPHDAGQRNVKFEGSQCPYIEVGLL